MKLILLILFLASTSAMAQTVKSQGISSARRTKQSSLITPESLAQQQLNAYNARDIEAFLEPYAEDIELYNLPDQLLSKGKEAMRKQYAGLFAQAPKLHCELVNRIVVDNTVVDHERVTLAPDRDPIQAIAIYKIEDGKIKKVYFTQ